VAGNSLGLLGSSRGLEGCFIPCLGTVDTGLDPIFGLGNSRWETVGTVGTSRIGTTGGVSLVGVAGAVTTGCSSRTGIEVSVILFVLIVVLSSLVGTAGGSSLNGSSRIGTGCDSSRGRLSGLPVPFAAGGLIIGRFFIEVFIPIFIFGASSISSCLGGSNTTSSVLLLSIFGVTGFNCYLLTWGTNNFDV